MKSLYKTTLHIWTDYDSSEMEMTDLAREATDGDAYCSTHICKKVEDPSKDKDWDGSEFFNEDDNEDVEEEDVEEEEDDE